jgi:hypothetical protein
MFEFLTRKPGPTIGRAAGIKTMNPKASLACRVREIREFLYGENGVDALARALRVHSATWLNYERGVTMPAEVLLDFIEVTGVDHHWLSTGKGERLIGGHRGSDSDWVRKRDRGTW